jgi:hypothetical protein
MVKFSKFGHGDSDHFLRELQVFIAFSDQIEKTFPPLCVYVVGLHKFHNLTKSTFLRKFSKVPSEMKRFFSILRLQSHVKLQLSVCASDAKQCNELI